MVPIPILVVNGDICRNVREYSPKQTCNDIWRGDAVLVCQYILFYSYICYGHNRRWVLIMCV